MGTPFSFRKRWRDLTFFDLACDDICRAVPDSMQYAPSIRFDAIVVPLSARGILVSRWLRDILLYRLVRLFVSS
jgi:hypothetical protein